MSGSNEDLAGKSRAELLELCKERGLKATGWKKERMLQELGSPAIETEKPDPEAAKKAVEEKQAETQDKVEAPATGKEASLQERMKARTGYCAAIGCTCESWLPEGMDVNRFWPMCACGHTQWSHAPNGESRPAVADPEGHPEKKDSDDLGGDVAVVEGEGGDDEGEDHEDHADEDGGVRHSE